MEEKFKRFLELSLRFTKTKSEVLGNYPQSNVGYIGSSGITDSFATLNFTDSYKAVEKSTADLIREEAEKRAVLADEFEEYLELQKNLGEYFRITEKLNN